MGSNKQAKNVNKAYDQEYQYLTGRPMNQQQPTGSPFTTAIGKLTGRMPAQYQQPANQHGVGGVYGDLYDDAWNRRQAADERSNRVYNDVYSGYQNILNDKTGGLDPGRVGQIDKYIGDYYDFAKGNTISEADRNRMRGGGVYDEFAKTGGYNDADLANIRSRGTSTIPAFYTSLRNDMDRRQAASGGFNPGFGAQTRALAREKARASADAALSTELGIKEGVNKGRMWGAEGMTSSESALQDLLSRNFIAGMGGASGLQMNLADAIRSGNLAALSGLQNLYTSVPGESLAYSDYLAKILGQRDSSVQGILGQKAAYNPNQSWFDKYGMPILQGGAGFLGTMLTGGGLGGGKAPTSAGLTRKYGPQDVTYA